MGNRWLHRLAYSVVLLSVASSVRSDPYLDPTVEVHSTHPDIVAKAQELGTALAIFKYVHDEIEYDVYYGSKRGALGTLWSGKGNDFDQASLLIALLRAQGVRARYALGQVYIDRDQLRHWARVRNVNVASIFFFVYCRLENNQGPCGHGKFKPPGQTPRGVETEHAWVEAELPAQYRGTELNNDPNDLIWIPLDPSWKRKDLPSNLVTVPIGNETVPDCSGQLCFDYESTDGYYAKLDPRLVSEIWERDIQTWLAENAGTVGAGKTVKDVIYDGPIRPFEGEVLPVSLPFDPVAGSPVQETADLGALTDGVPRRFQMRVTAGGVDALFDFPYLVDKRLTFAFEPTTTARRTVLQRGGFFGGPHRGADSLFEFCLSTPAASECKGRRMLKVDGVSCGTVSPLKCEDTAITSLGATSASLEITPDLVPGYPATAAISYPLTNGMDAAIGLDGGHSSPAQVQREFEELFATQASLSLHDEGEADDNGNGVVGEVLVVQGAAGVQTCPNYGASNAMTTCDISVTAHSSIKDDFVGQLLHVATLRYFERIQTEADRVLQLDKFVGFFPPKVAVAKTNYSFTYLFDRPVGVEPATPVLDSRKNVFDLSGIDSFGNPALLRREARRLAHILSVLEHQIWEELIGLDFVSTFKGFQLVRERFPEEPIYEFDSSNYNQVMNLGNHPLDTLSQGTLDRISTLAQAPDVENTVFTPVAAVSARGSPLEVYYVETEVGGGVQVQMAVVGAGETLGGACGFGTLGCGGSFSDAFVDTFDETIFDPGANPGDADTIREALNQGEGFFGSQPTLPHKLSSPFLHGSPGGDPVSLVSGNLVHSERDLRLRTSGPAFEFVRTYNSRSSELGALGHGWTHSYEMRVEPTRDEREFVYLPDRILTGAFENDAEVWGVVSDTLDTSNAGQGTTAKLHWEGLPATLFDQVDSIVLEIAYSGSFSVDVRAGPLGSESLTLVDEVVDSGGASGVSVARFELESGGSPHTDPGPMSAFFGESSSFGTTDQLVYARLHVRYRGAEVQRIPLTAQAFTGWDPASGLAPLTDDDPSTCVAPAGTSATIDFQLDPGIVNPFAVEVIASVKQDFSGLRKTSVWLGDSIAPQQEEFRTGPGEQKGARQRFVRRRDANDLDRVTFDVGATPQVELCKLTYNVLAMPEQAPGDPQQVDVLLASGAKERYTRDSVGAWVDKPGVRNRLTDLSPGYLLTAADGREFYFEEPGTNDTYHLSRIADPQGRGLNLTYQSGVLHQVVEDDVPGRALTFAYQAGHLDTVTDWDGRVWDYDVDVNGDLEQAKDPLEFENGWPGTTYEYEFDPAQVNEGLNHNLVRVVFPKDDLAEIPGPDHWIQFEYDHADRVIAHTDSLGNRQTFLINHARLESQVTDARGFRTIYRHDVQGNLLQRVDPDGAIWDWEYDADRNVTREIDPFGLERVFSGHNDRGNPALIVERDQRQIGFPEYDDVSGQPKQIIDKRGNKQIIEFATGLPTEERATFGPGSPAPELVLVRRIYDPATHSLDRVIRAVGAPLPTTQAVTVNAYSPDKRDLLTQELGEDADGDDAIDTTHSIENFRYDALGRLEQQWIDRAIDGLDMFGGPTQHVETRFQYDKRDQLERVTRPDGTVQVFEYDRNGNLEEEYLEETVLDQGGPTILQHNRKTYTYDAIDRLIKITDALGGVTALEYDAVGNRIAETDPAGNTTRFEYDAMNRLIRTIDATGASTRFEYDLMGRVIAETDPTEITTTRQYDAAGQLVALQVGGSQPATRAILYDDAPGVPPRGLRHVLTDPNGQATGKTTTIDFDDLGRPSGVTDAEGGPATIQYNHLDELVQFTDPAGGVTTFDRQVLGRVVDVTRPYAAQVRLHNDETGLPLTALKTGTGCSLHVSYDVMDRILERRSEGCPAAIEPVHDEFGYDARGNLVAARNEHVGLIREYDALNRLVREIDDRFGSSVAYLYDQASRLTTKIYPDGSALQVSYDAASRPIGITDPFGDTTRYVYDAAGSRIQTRSSRSGLRSELVYDPLGRLSLIESFRADGSPAASRAYPSHDEVGNRLRMDDVVAATTTTYDYDGLHRLIVEDGPNTVNPFHFEYDAAGNRERVGENSGSTWVHPYFDYAYEGPGTTHRLSSVTFTSDMGQVVESFAYDAYGMVTTWDRPSVPTFSARTLGWDALDRLVGIQSADFSGAYAYDPFGRRIQKTEQETTTLYQYDGLDVVAEYGAAKALEATYVFGPGIDEPIKVERSGEVAAFHADGLGSVVMVTRVSDSATLATYEYDAFGADVAPPSSFANTYTFTGRERDASGLYYYRARYYLPEVGRFLSPDPIGLEGGVNPYAYVGSNPVNFRDPFGLDAVAGAAVLNNAVVPEPPPALAGRGALGMPTSQSRLSPSSQRNLDATLFSLAPLFERALGGGRAEEFAAGCGGEPFCLSVAASMQQRVRNQANFFSAVTFGILAGAPLAAEFGAARFSIATRGATSVATPHGRAFQRLSRDALDLRSEVAGGRQVFRGGNFGRSAAGEGQFFSVESPLSPGFADRVGAATLGRGTPDFVIGGTVRPGAGFITRRAPPFGKNTGGALEVVTEPGAVRLDFFHMP